MRTSRLAARAASTLGGNSIAMLNKDLSSTVSPSAIATNAGNATAFPCIAGPRCASTTSCAPFRKSGSVDMRAS